MTDASTFMGFRRDDGRVGVRNLEAVIPSCGCSLHAAKMIASQVPGAVVLECPGGCGETEVDTRLATDLRAQYGRESRVSKSDTGVTSVAAGAATGVPFDSIRSTNAGRRPMTAPIRTATIPKSPAIHAARI